MIVNNPIIEHAYNTERLEAYKNRLPIPKSPFSFIKPDSMDNISHNIPDEISIKVLDANGLPIFGRIVNNQKGYYCFKLNNYIYVKS